LTAAAMMRERDEKSGSRFRSVDFEDQIPFKQPLRKIELALNGLEASVVVKFEAVCVDFGRPSIAPESLVWDDLARLVFGQLRAAVVKSMCVFAKILALRIYTVILSRLVS